MDRPDKITNSAETDRKIVLVDFDGVFVDTKEFDLHKITGEYIHYTIPWLMELMDHNFDVRIFSARCNVWEGIIVMQDWFKWIGLPEDYLRDLKFEPGKPSAHLIIDDRAITFKGDPLDFTPSLVRDFKPWNR